ncbi:uncharacterized protein [Rutidosis leptorrhynchoides]|uniref:uncharacterized protein isoform X2 n=1 Tax=Rutidosis leptorrhynchoides TaxID=125765 RepID=UPI003A995465
MEKTEPTFVPEWLKNGASSTTISHQSSLHTDDQGVSKTLRNKSYDKDLGRTTTSSYFRRSSSNGVSSRSYSSFGRNRDRDSVRRRDYKYSDPLASSLPSRFEAGGLRRSQSNLSVKCGESWPQKEKKDHNSYGKISLESDFPSLKLENGLPPPKNGDVTSSGLSCVVQSLSIGGDVWTSALAEVPVTVRGHGNNVSVQQTVQPGSISGTSTVITGRNMAETLVQGPPRAQTAPQLSVGTQRLEELAVKQSRQLIPMTPTMPKASASSLSDKPKLKFGQLQHQSSLPRLVSVKSDVSKASSSSSPSSLSPHTVGKLQILKPSRNGSSIPTVNETSCSSPTAGSNVPNSPIAVVGSASFRNNDVATIVVERKPCVEKKPSLQAKSRHDFFNLMRKKSLVDNSSVTGSSELTNGPAGGTEDGPMEALDMPCGAQFSDENKDDSSCNGETQRYSNNGKDNSSVDVIMYSEEEEARFLRSLGWEETAEEEEGLTEEEINSFYRDYMNSNTALNFFKGTKLESLMPHNLQMEKNGGILHETTTKVES